LEQLREALLVLLRNGSHQRSLERRKEVVDLLEADDAVEEDVEDLVTRAEQRVEAVAHRVWVGVDPSRDDARDDAHVLAHHGSERVANQRWGPRSGEKQFEIRKGLLESLLHTPSSTRRMVALPGSQLFIELTERRVRDAAAPDHYCPKTLEKASGN